MRAINAAGASPWSAIANATTPVATPPSQLLDTFNRANGAVGANWGGDSSAFAIAANQLDVPAGDHQMTWNTAFGPEQEAYITLSAIDAAATEIDLMLKTQDTWQNGLIEVWYQPARGSVIVVTYDPAQGWVERGAAIPVVFAAGDVFRAKAFADGSVQVFRNATLLGTSSVAGWPAAANGGRIGVWTVNADATRLDDFGGGDLSGAPVNTAPTVALTAPVSGAGFTAPATIALAASASDSDGTVAKVEFFNGTTKLGEDTASPYAYNWTGVAAGGYTLTAKATDNSGAVTTSAAVTVTVTTATAGLPAPWTTVVIGGATPAGSASYDAATQRFTVVCGGTDIWGATDQFRFVSQDLSGDGSVTAQVVSLTNSNAWAKAGVMLRDGTATNGRHAMTVVTPGKGVVFQRRSTVGGASSSTAGPSVAAPRWLRIARSGNVLNSSSSADGTTWSAIGSATITLPATARAGLCLTSHKSGTPATAVFASVAVAPSGGG